MSEQSMENPLQTPMSRGKFVKLSLATAAGISGLGVVAGAIETFSKATPMDPTKVYLEKITVEPETEIKDFPTIAEPQEPGQQGSVIGIEDKGFISNGGYVVYADNPTDKNNPIPFLRYVGDGKNYYIDMRQKTVRYNSSGRSEFIKKGPDGKFLLETTNQPVSSNIGTIKPLVSTK